MEKKICELFAGVGGFRLGFDRLESGWQTTWFSQWEPGAKTQWALHGISSLALSCPYFPRAPPLSMVKHVVKSEFRGLSAFCLNSSQSSRFFFSSPTSVNGTTCGQPLSIIYVRAPVSIPSMTQHVVKNHPSREQNLRRSKQ